MGLFRRKLECFYCGRKSGQIWQSGLRSFKCANCESTNYLDKFGDITDPPISKVASKSDNQYIKSSFTSRSSSPPIQSGGVFCHTCMSNQQFLTQALAEYLPPASDPRYEEYQRNLQSYRRQLEARYPQVCSECEPRVKAQIRAAGYIAKSDFLRHMNDRTKRSSVQPNGSARRRIVGVLAGFFWVAAHLANVTWALIGLRASEDLGMNFEPAATFGACLRETAGGGEVDPTCREHGEHIVKIGLLINALFIWWNPVLLYSERRARGVGEFYKLQLLLLLLRGLTWLFLKEASAAGFEHSTVRGTFAFNIILNVVMTVVSLGKARPVPRIIRFHNEIETNDNADYENGWEVEATDASENKIATQKLATMLPRTFPIQDLGNNHAMFEQPVKAPIPSEHEVDLDAMDLDTPENTKCAPRMSHMVYRDNHPQINSDPLVKKSVFKTPNTLDMFTTKLGREQPARRRSHSYRKGRTASDWDIETVASSCDVDSLATGGDNDSDDASIVDRSFVPSTAKTRKEYDFKQASFHVEEEETGLEGMLGFFGLKDDPLENIPGTPERKIGFYGNEISATEKGRLSRIAGEKKGLIALPKALWQYSVPANTAPIFILAIAIASFANDQATWTVKAEFAALMWIVSAALLRLNYELDVHRQLWVLSSIFIFVLEAMFGILLAIKLAENMFGVSSARHAKIISDYSTARRDEDVFQEHPIGETYTDGSFLGGTISDSVFEIATKALMTWVAMQEILIAVKQRIMTHS